MVDVQKVVNGLACCDIDNDLTCFQCPYEEINYLAGMAVCTSQLSHDVLELIKQQTTVIDSEKIGTIVKPPKEG